MRFEDLLQKYQNFPYIDINSVSLCFNESKENLSIMFYRWVKANKLLRLKKGLYIFADEYRGNPISNFYLASIILQPSYISMEKALEHYGLIPENVFSYTSLTTSRSNVFVNIKGRFNYRHIQEGLFRGYSSIRENSFSYYIATPEKAILDYIYINRHSVSKSYLESLRLQNLNMINIERLRNTATWFNNNNINKAVALITEIHREYNKEFKKL